jgi:tRNA-specific 2-thiouridylase
MKVLVAMSGGVDSSVAAALLRDAGHQVVGVTMRLWGGESDTGCCSVSDVDDARRVAQQLDIDHLVFNFTDDFHRAVVDPYVNDHARGITPNPCIECNRHLKFDRLLERADLLGFDAVATGHHARVTTVDGSRRVARGADAAKDQSYVVHMLGAEALARTIFPVGHLHKSEVRALAAELGLRTASKPDSQDVCFITSKSADGASGRSSFLRKRIPLHPARVVDESGAELGAVDSVEMVTLGQRRGVAGGGGGKRFVVDVDVAGRVVTVGPESSLLVEREHADAAVWSAEVFEGDCLVQCSAHGEPRRARVANLPDGTVEVHWTEPQRRVSPGQSVVFYDLDDQWVIGGATVRPTPTRRVPAATGTPTSF